MARNAKGLQEALQEIFARYARQLATTVSRKTKPARAMTIDTLLQIDANAGGKILDGPGATDQLIGSLPDLFIDLPPERQQTLLSSFWYRIRSPAMLPVLRQLLKHISAIVREGALIGLSAFYLYKEHKVKFPQDVLERIKIMAQSDPSPTIKECAKSIIEDWESS